MPELLPCPFCGANLGTDIDEPAVGVHFSHGHYRLECWACRHNAWHDSKEIAIANWNRRTPAPGTVTLSVEDAEEIAREVYYTNAGTPLNRAIMSLHAAIAAAKGE